MSSKHPKTETERQINQVSIMRNKFSFWTLHLWRQTQRLGDVKDFETTLQRSYQKGENLGNTAKLAYDGYYQHLTISNRLVI